METLIYPEKTTWVGNELQACFIYESGDSEDPQDWIGSWNRVWELKGTQYMNYGEATYKVTGYDSYTGRVELTKVVDITEA
ncbi:hypothetical protein KC669_01675 [Candidatus Dojkabacteria bacterium]|uniref:Uncharacterized protein n=1 Tax=Candidatus Dojkabacteria bacterium TaxID=2099670 RepID=A0A955LB16_9BACT|nr:hypothetical protein [Candidatus Dojkabacteria bacterium]